MENANQSEWDRYQEVERIRIEHEKKLHQAKYERLARFWADVRAGRIKPGR